MMATVLPCGHTEAQHFYSDSGDLELEPCPAMGICQESLAQAARQIERHFQDNGDIGYESALAILQRELGGTR